MHVVQAWNGLQSIVPLSAIHNEQQYDRALNLLHKLLDQHKKMIRKGVKETYDESRADKSGCHEFTLARVNLLQKVGR